MTLDEVATARYAQDAFIALALFHVFVVIHEYTHLAHSYLTSGTLPGGWVIHAKPLAGQYIVHINSAADLAANSIWANGVPALLALGFTALLVRRERWLVAVGPVWYYLVTCYHLLAVSGVDAERIHEAYGYAPAVALLGVGVAFALAWVVVARTRREKQSIQVDRATEEGR